MICRWSGYQPLLLHVVFCTISVRFSKKNYDEGWMTEDDEDRPQPNTSTEDEVDSIRTGTICNALKKYFEDH